MPASAQPLVIQKSDPEALRIEWDDGHETRYTARELRLLCPCAQCIEEMTGRALLDPATVPQDLTQDDVQLVGNYALALRFSDGHHTGIYPFVMLRENDPAR